VVGVSRTAKIFTPKQGQYLAFIHLYTRLHCRPPAETDMQQYFRVSPPSVQCSAMLASSHWGYHVLARARRIAYSPAVAPRTSSTRIELVRELRCQNRQKSYILAGLI